MSMRRLLALAMALCMIMSFGGTFAFATEAQSNSENLAIEQLDPNDVQMNLAQNDAVNSDLTLNEEQIDANEIVRVVVVMEGESIVQMNSAAVVDDTTKEQAAELEQAQAQLIAEIESSVLDGEKLDIAYNYTWLVNGFATQVPYGAIKDIAQLDGVKNVVRQIPYTVCKTDEVALPHTIHDGVTIGREPTWGMGYTGEGMKIAIIDTGLDIDHQNFAPLSEDKLTDTSADKSTVAAVLDSLNASSRFSGLTADDLYYNTKVVYGFNYCDNNLNITHDFDNMGPHGTHVAGIAAANKVDGSEVVGVAPDAQLYVLKVFGENGGAYPEDILAALEDALKLGADVVNMSLGTPAGFTSGDILANGKLLDPVYESVTETGTILSVSAGNSYTSAFANAWGTDQNLTIYPDNGVVGNPGTYTNTMTVASVENTMVERNYIDAEGYHITYIDSYTYGPAPLPSLTGAYEIVVVGGYGEPADYEGLDVAGKVALVSRGVTSFVEKHEAAHAAGAVATLIFNNEEGEIGLNLTDGTATSPCASITKAHAEYLIAALAENPGLKLTFPKDMDFFPNPFAGTMSDFSSWGPAPDLSLAPDITAPGGYIYSTVNDGGYATMSGTSMAAPNIAGMSALVLQYVKETFPAGTDYRKVAQDLMMSTAIPLINEEMGALYSPRNQGSGVANVFNAITTQAYLTVDGAEMPKVELGDDPGRTGAYSYQFNVTNFGETNLYYAMGTTVQTEHVDDYGGGLAFMNGKPLTLQASAVESCDSMVLVHDVDNNGVTDSHDAYLIYMAAIGEAQNENWADEAFRYDVNASETVETDDVQAYLDALVGNDSVADLEAEVLVVEAGETAVIGVDIALADFDKQVFAYYYPNGGYVEGFTILNALNGSGVSLSLPYLAFYGDWNESPVLDEGAFWDYYAEGYEEGMFVANQYPHVLLTQFAGEDDAFYPGLNAYINEPFDVNHISLSPNEDGYADTISDIYISLMRNAAQLNFYYNDAETGEEIFSVGGENISKTCYNQSYDEIVPFVASWYEGAIFDVSQLPNNTKLVMTVEAIGVGADEDEADYWQVPITIDTEAPILDSAVRTEDPETGKVTLDLTFRDNLAVSVVGLLDSTGSKAYALEGTVDEAPVDGYRTYTKSYDITGMNGKLIILLSDYALNEVYYGINLGGEGAAYGDLVAFQYNFETGSNTWVSFNEDVNLDETAIFLGSNVDFVAAEYVAGYVFAQTDTGALYGFRYEDMLKDTMDLESTYIAQLDNVYQDLAYNFYDGNLYGLLTTEEEWYGEISVQSEIFSINLKGQYFDEDLYMERMPYQEDWAASRGNLYGLGLACDDEGSVYIMGTYQEPEYDEDWNFIGLSSSNAQLWKASFEENWGYVSLGAFTMVGDTGLSMDFLQSMTWDHNTETLRWARFAPLGVFDLACELYTVNPETAEVTLTGKLSGETCAMFAPWSAETAAKPEHANVPTMDASVVGTPILRDDVLTMNVGGTRTLIYDLDPWYTDHKEVVWSSSDDSVLSVDAHGKITATGTGSAVITVANKADETKFDTVSVEVTALDLKIEGIVAEQLSGIGNVGAVHTYEFNMVNGNASMEMLKPITASADLDFGLSLVTSAYGRGSIWACEYGNTGMIYEIDAATGAVKDVFEPLDGDMIFGLTYNERMDNFAAIMNMYMYVDLPMNHESYEEMQGSYNEELGQFTWHRLNMLPYLLEAGSGFVTGETGQGASSEVVFCGITSIDGGIRDAYGETMYFDTYRDYLGNWAMGMGCEYQPDQTLVLLDNVGRLWYINEVSGATMESDEWGNVAFFTPDGGMIDGTRNGVLSYEYKNEDGTSTYSVFHITKIVETPLTDMFRDGTMPRYTYHFSDVEFAGYTADGDPIFAMSLYDYWNGGTTNEFYLYIPGHETEEMDPETYEPIVTPDRMFNLGNSGNHQIIATINKVTVTGGLDQPQAGEGDEAEVFSARPLTAGVYSK